MCRKSNDQISREYCSRYQLWSTWQFETTEWYNPECMCTSLLYNIDLQIQANHSTNHSIAFPMNDPMECLKKLPCLDEKYCPQVTFLGPRDEWMKKAGKYKYLYKMDTDIAYDWLRVWVDANPPSFQNCIIDISDIVCDGLNYVTEKLLKKQ
jgi:hypothetical protein